MTATALFLIVIAAWLVALGRADRRSTGDLVGDLRAGARVLRRLGDANAHRVERYVRELSGGRA